MELNGNKKIKKRLKINNNNKIKYFILNKQISVYNLMAKLKINSKYENLLKKYRNDKGKRKNDKGRETKRGSYKYYLKLGISHSHESLTYIFT